VHICAVVVAVVGGAPEVGAHLYSLRRFWFVFSFTHVAGTETKM